MKRFLFVGLAVIGMMAATPRVHAVVLTPGTSSLVINSSTLTGLTLVDTFSVAPAALNPPALDDQTIFGTYQEWVYRNDVTGTLTFLEQVNIAPGSEAVHRMTVVSYTGFTTDVTFLTGGLPPTAVAGGIQPNNLLGPVIDRSADGKTVGFNFITTQLSGGTSSAVLAIATNATTYNRLGVLNVIDGSVSQNRTFQPTGSVQAVPEPTTLAIAGLGGLGMIGYGLRRRKAMGA